MRTYRKLTSESNAGRVWYVAYGSNMNSARLHHYLVGGTPPGGGRAYPGCRDHRPPLRTAAVPLPGGIYFALESQAWGGGMAFYDHELLPGQAAARAYLLTAEQFSDIAAQEMYRQPGALVDIDGVVERGRLTLGAGRYETMVHVGARDGSPMITFTAPWRQADVPANSPAPRYLELISSGLHEARSWSASEIAEYLIARPGVAGNWGMEQLRRLAERGVDRGVR